jgi:hypothetical protein
LEQSKSDELSELGVEEAVEQAEVTTEEAPRKERKIFFETKTMAEVYAKQGHTVIALEIYKRVFQKNPSDSEAQKKISELQAKLPFKKEKFAKPQD